jgi:hypothetical protein
MYKKMDAGERAGKLAELARLLGILEALADGPLLVEGAGGPTTADAALFPTLCFCRSVRTGARAVLQRREGCWRMLLWRSRCRVPVVCRPHARLAHALMAVTVPRACRVPAACKKCAASGAWLGHQMLADPHADRTGCACTPLPYRVASSQQAAAHADSADSLRLGRHLQEPAEAGRLLCCHAGR